MASALSIFFVLTCFGETPTIFRSDAEEADHPQVAASSRGQAKRVVVHSKLDQGAREAQGASWRKKGSRPETVS
ncbi:hypothetical protein DIPPA_02497 [Diplonema papillatum]|nr:hypothetical protein DIPPA_02497 [Diplonema papillatum]